MIDDLSRIFTNVDSPPPVDSFTPSQFFLGHLILLPVSRGELVGFGERRIDVDRI